MSTQSDKRDEFQRKLKAIEREIGREALADALQTSQETVSRYINQKKSPKFYQKQAEGILKNAEARRDEFRKQREKAEMERRQNLAERDLKYRLAHPLTAEDLQAWMKRVGPMILCDHFYCACVKLDAEKQNLILDHLDVFCEISYSEREILKKFHLVPAEKKRIILEHMKMTVSDENRISEEHPASYPCTWKRREWLPAFEEQWGNPVPETEEPLSLKEVPSGYRKTRWGKAMFSRIKEYTNSLYFLNFNGETMMDFVKFDRYDWELLLCLGLIEESKNPKYIPVMPMFSDYLDEWAGCRFVWEKTDMYLAEKLNAAEKQYYETQNYTGRIRRKRYEVTEHVKIRSLRLGEYTAFYEVENTMVSLGENPDGSRCHIILPLTVTINASGDLIREDELEEAIQRLDPDCEKKNRNDKQSEENTKEKNENENKSDNTL